MTLRRAKPFWAKKKEGGSSFLLDNFSGASVAFSFRKLKSDYSGNCVRLGSDDISNFYDIGFETNYVNKSEIVTAQTDYGSGSGSSRFVQVQRFYDQSGNSNNLVRSASSNIYLSDLSNTNIQLSTPNVSLRYVSGELQLSSDVQLINIFAVFKIATYGNITYLLYKNDGGNSGAFLAGTFAGINGFGIAKPGAPSGIMVQGNEEGFLLKLATFDGFSSSKKIYNNGALLSTATSFLSNPFGQKLIATGGGIYNLVELIVFSGDISSVRSDIEMEINSYYSIY